MSQQNSRFPVVVLTGVLLLVLVCSLFFACSAARDTLNEQVENQHLETAFAARQFENHLRGVQEELITLSKAPVVLGISAANCNSGTALHSTLGQTLDVVLRADKAGLIVACSSSLYAEYAGINIVNKDYFQLPRRTREPYGAFIGQGLPLFVVSVPLFVTTEYTPYPNFKGEFNGVLLSFVSLPNVQELYLHPLLGSSREGYVLYRQNDKSIIASNLEENVSLRLRTLNYSFAKQGGVESLDGEGTFIVTTSEVAVFGENWRLVVSRPLSKLTGSDLVVMGLVIGVVLCLAILGVFMFFRKDSNRGTSLIEHKSEKAHFALNDVPIESGAISFIQANGEVDLLELFRRRLEQGAHGLVFLRQRPGVASQDIDFPHTERVWLAADGTFSLDTLYEQIQKKMALGAGFVVALERLDYLVLRFGVEEVLKFLHRLQDLITGTPTVVLCSVALDSLAPQAWKALCTVGKELFGATFRESVKLDPLGHSILEYISRESALRIVSYGSITEQFSITKPTTRVKVAHLARLGLVRVEQRGRFKTLVVTAAGRAVLAG